MDKTLKVIITAETDKLKKGVKDAQAQVSSFSDQVKKASGNVDQTFAAMGKAAHTAFAVASAAAVAAAGAVLAFTTSTATAADTVDKMSQRLGLSREAYQQWDYVLSQSGVDIQSFQTGMKSLLANMDGVAEGSKEATARFEALGVSVLDADGKMRSQEAVLYDTVAAFQSMENGAEKSRLAQELFGRQGQEILPLLNSEAGSMEALSQKAKDLGLIMGDDAVDAGVQFTDTLDTLKRAIASIKNGIGAELMPVVTGAMQFVIDHMPEIREAVAAAGEAVRGAISFAVEHKELLLGIGAAIGSVVAAIELYNAVAAVKRVMDAAQVASIGALIAAHAAQAVAAAAAIAPYLLIVAAIGAVIAIIVLCIKHWDEITAAVSEAVDNIVKTVQALWEAVKAFFGKIAQAVAEKVNAALNAASSAFEGIKTAISDKISAAKDVISSVIGTIRQILSFQGLRETVAGVFDGIRQGIADKLNAARDFVGGVIDKIRGFFNFSWELPRLKLPHLNISGSFSLAPPSVPSFSIDWYARGGVFDKPTIFAGGGGLAGIGEAGAEAVVPLERNTEWLDRIAERLQGGGREVVLMVDGRELGRAAIDGINGLTRQTGRLGLVIA